MRKPRGPEPQAITLTERHRTILEQIVRRANSPQCLVTRAKIVLKAAGGFRNQQIADTLDLHVQTPRRWRNRWAEASGRLTAVETEADERELRLLIKDVLSDQPRSGSPSTFSPEQICQIVALACEPPAGSERPVTNWTPKELADEAIKRGIVESISPRSVGRFLKRSGLEASSISVLAE